MLKGVGVGVRVWVAVCVGGIGVSVFGIKVCVGTDITVAMLLVFVQLTIDIQQITIRRNKLLSLTFVSQAD